MSALIEKAEKYFDVMPEATNYSLKKTFKFIQGHPLDDKGNYLKTTIFLALNLLKTQVSGEVENRLSASHTVTGFITDVTDTNVVVLSDTKCNGIYDEYTIVYSSIIEVESLSVYYYFNEYIRYMNSNNFVDKDINDQYIEMLNKEKEILGQIKEDEIEGIQIIFNGVKSRLIYLSELTIINNLFIISQIFIIPLTYIGGTVVIPKCDDKALVEVKMETKEERKDV